MMKLLFSLSLLFVAVLARAEEAPANKLRAMYRLYYLPMGIEFKETDTKNDLLPYVESAAGRYDRLLKPEELEAIDNQWTNIKQDWQKKSLLLKNPAELGRTQVISQSLRNHYVKANRSANEIVAITSDSAQVKLLKSFLQPREENKTHFFIVGPDWCLSSLEYRILLEALFKEFQDPKYVLHNVMVADPEQKIFDSKFIKEILPDTSIRKLETVPVFIALQFKEGKAVVLEEGDAIEMLLEKHLLKHRGYLKGSSTPSAGIAKSP